MNTYHYFLITWRNLTLKERIMVAMVLFFLVTFGIGLAIVSWIVGVIAVLIIAGVALLALVGVIATVLVQKLILRLRGSREIQRRDW
jgi:uncharacterized membrane protein